MHDETHYSSRAPLLHSVHRWLHSVHRARPCVHRARARLTGGGVVVHEDEMGGVLRGEYIQQKPQHASCPRRAGRSDGTHQQQQ